MREVRVLEDLNPLNPLNPQLVTPNWLLTDKSTISRAPPTVHALISCKSNFKSTQSVQRQFRKSTLPPTAFVLKRSNSVKAFQLLLNLKVRIQ